MLLDSLRNQFLDALCWLRFSSKYAHHIPIMRVACNGPKHEALCKNSDALLHNFHSFRQSFPRKNFLCIVLKQSGISVIPLAVLHLAKTVGLSDGFPSTYPLGHNASTLSSIRP